MKVERKKIMRKKLENKKGFTLAELLVVVAIIAVLTAIAIPVFAGALEKSAEATDLANIRSAYAELCVKYLQGDIEDYAGENGSGDNCIEVPATQSQDKWQSDNNEDTTTISTTFQGGSTNAVEVKYKTKGEFYSVRISNAGVVTVDN